MKKLKGILVDTRKGIIPTKIDYNDFHDLTNALGCKWLACVTRRIGGIDVDVYCDEEALLKPAREPALITRDKKTKQIVEVLFGNIFICLHNRLGDVKSLYKMHYDPILLTQASITHDDGKTYRVLQAEM